MSLARSYVPVFNLYNILVFNTDMNVPVYVNDDIEFDVVGPDLIVADK